MRAFTYLQVSLFLCRDLDSRISAREVAAVTEWLRVKIFQSRKIFHC